MTQVDSFTTTDIQVMSGGQLDAFWLASPIVLDLDGHGIRTTAAAQGVQFDLNATGPASKVGWVSAGEGLLVMDRNHDGKINDGSELFGVATKDANGQRAGNGYAAMALEDSNHDGRLTAADKNFNELKVWVDANHDGKTDKGELHALADFGIVEVDLHATKGTEVDHGNLLGLVSSYKTGDGAHHAMADVWFAKDASHPAPLPVALGDVLAAPTADVLPVAPGHVVPATHVADASAGGMSAMLVNHQMLKEDEHKNLPLI